MRAPRPRVRQNSCVRWADAVGDRAVDADAGNLCSRRGRLICCGSTILLHRPALNSRLDKLLVAEATGFIVPPTLVTNDPDKVEASSRDHAGSVISKPLTYYSEAPDVAVFTNRVPEN